MRLSNEETRRIENLINLIMNKGNISEDEAVNMLYKFVCRGSCDWHVKSSQKVGFDRLSLTNEQRILIEKSIDQIMKGLAIGEARIQIHGCICKR